MERFIFDQMIMFLNKLLKKIMGEQKAINANNLINIQTGKIVKNGLNRYVYNFS